MRDGAVQAAAGWLAEAWETGNPLAPLPPELTPERPEEGQDIAAAVLEAIGAVACGLRLAPGPDGAPVAGPMLETRLLPAGSMVTLAALRRPVATAAILAMLAEPLPPEEDGRLPAFTALHPALDLAASRFRDPPGSAALQAADLGGLGQVVAGRGGGPLPDRPVPVALAPAGRRPVRGTSCDLRAALAPAVAAARAWGGLPAGAVLVVAGLSPPILPEPGTELVVRIGTLGRVTARFA